MKKINLLIICVILTIISCSKQYLLESQNNRNIITNINSYSHEEGFCSANYYLNSDRTFLYETGCEGRSHIVLGEWEIERDSIKLNYYAQNYPFKFIKNYTVSSTYKSKIKTLILKDKFNITINHFDIEFKFKNYKTEEDYWDAFFQSHKRSEELFNKLNLEKRMLYKMKTDENGIIVFNTEDLDSIYFPVLKKIFNKKVGISIKNFPDTLILNLDINKEGVMYHSVDYLNHFDVNKTYKHFINDSIFEKDFKSIKYKK